MDRFHASNAFAAGRLLPLAKGNSRPIAAVERPQESA